VILLQTALQKQQNGRGTLGTEISSALQISCNRRRSTDRTGTGQNGCWLQIRCKCSETAHTADVLPAVGTILNTAAGEIAPSEAVQLARRLEPRGAAPPAFAEKSGHDFAMRPTNTTGLQYPATRIVCAGFFGDMNLCVSGSSPPG
jgi:hypothetical protein